MAETLEIGLSGRGVYQWSQAAEAAQDVSMAQEEVVLDMEPSTVKWSDHLRKLLIADVVREQLERIAALPLNWDSYGARPVDKAVLVAIGTWLVQVVEAGMQFPALVPTTRGGVSLEWTAPGREFSVTLTPDHSRRATAYYFDAATGGEWEAPLSASDERLSRAMNEWMSEAS